MKNLMEIDGYKALIAFNPETDLFRGHRNRSFGQAVPVWPHLSRRTARDFPR